LDNSWEVRREKDSKCIYNQVIDPIQWCKDNLISNQWWGLAMVIHSTTRFMVKGGLFNSMIDDERRFIQWWDWQMQVYWISEIGEQRFIEMVRIDKQDFIEWDGLVHQMLEVLWQRLLLPFSFAFDSNGTK
jgi:hypothetical protein